MLQRAKSFAEKHERRLSVSAFLLGFLWDYLTLTRVDRLFDNLMLASYLVVALAGIVALNAHGAGRLRGGFGQRGVVFLRFTLPFAFGGLFSGFLIFYSQAGIAVASAPFLLVLALFFFGNEFWKKHYERFTFQMSVFFVALFSYCSLVVPVALGKIGAGIFIVSGIVALLLFWLVLHLLRRVAKEAVEKSRARLASIVVIIFITFNFLYFNNMIPPIPLSLKEIGVYHSISRTRSGEYVLAYESPRWHEFGRKTSGTFHRSGEGSVYAFSSVYAPTRLDTSVTHRWSRFSAKGGSASGRDEKGGEWVSQSAIPFTISGGRAEGFRGYSAKENVTAGKWRIDVETPRGQVIGRFVFTVDDSGESPELKTETR